MKDVNNLTEFERVRNTVEEMLIGVRNEINAFLGEGDSINDKTPEQVQKGVEKVRQSMTQFLNRWTKEYHIAISSLWSYWKFFVDERERFRNLKTECVNLNEKCLSWFTTDYIERLSESIKNAKIVHEKLELYVKNVIDPVSPRRFDDPITPKDVETLIEEASLLIQFRKNHKCADEFYGDASDAGFTEAERDEYKKEMREHFNFFFA